MKIVIPRELKSLSKIFPKDSRLFIVGGYIRDLMLNKNSNDIDVTSSLTIDELEKILIGSNFVLKNKNKKCGTAQICYLTNLDIKFDYATFRVEKYKEDGSHSPSTVKFANTLEEDVYRRDFSINSIYYDINSKKIIDIFNGIYDLKNKILKEIQSTTLKYDGERILRLIKFSAKLGFDIEEKTLFHALKHKNNIMGLSDTTLQKFTCDINSMEIENRKRAKSLLALFKFEDLLSKIKTNGENK